MYRPSDYLMDKIKRDRVMTNMSNSINAQRYQTMDDNYTMNDEPTRYNKNPINSYHFESGNDYTPYEQTRPEPIRREVEYHKGFAGSHDDHRYLEDCLNRERLESMESKINYILFAIFMILFVHIIVGFTAILNGVMSVYHARAV